ncbi:endonuclease/exonuclease/phosphatase family protein [Vibrio sp. ZSDZ34]|uniref:Endonuclease/exonuclease/phosphatase family protein n=1 Tax=Vibrio gelatinilyticus TaxID=2893468 RepID=A0A9X1WBM2_9VIBR|nr:endonuclease/exonuclease/phosphatase family protein [Vibrio gelatinilyticus]MCJ2376163.1 endonuclease/exonuclease/phosphatase family protein [Vibrio gelatinilyticus]
MPSTSTIKVATLNLYNFVAPPNAFYEMENIYSRKQWQQKTQWLQRTLSEVDADIIGFQEVFSAIALEELVKSAGYPYFAINEPCVVESDYIHFQPSVAIASRFPMRLQSNPSFPSGHDYQFSRRPLHVSVSTSPLGELDCFVVHLKSQRPMLPEVSNSDDTLSKWLEEIEGSMQSTSLRQSEVLYLHQYIVKSKQLTQRPFVLMGDFNNNLTAPEFAPLRSTGRHRRPDSQETIAPYTFHDSWQLSLEQQCLAIDSNHTQPTEPITHFHGERGNRLDHILVSCEFCANHAYGLFNVVDYQLVDKHIVDPTYGIDDQGSDHALVCITIAERQQ